MKLRLAHILPLCTALIGIASAKLQAQHHSPFTSALVGLVDATEASGIYCKGVAISATSVLTAAHCVTGRRMEEISLLSSMGNVSVSRISVHPLYSKKVRINQFDVAVVHARGKLTAEPWPILSSSDLASGDSFITFTEGEIEARDHAAQFWARRMQVADAESMIQRYLQLRGASLPYPKLAQDLTNLLERGDSRIQAKIQREFGGMIFSLYEKNRTSICRGDSGSPAVVSRGGKIGIVGIATAIGKLEGEGNPSCSAGSTSIFTRVDNPEVLNFLSSDEAELHYF